MGSRQSHWFVGRPERDISSKIENSSRKVERDNAYGTVLRRAELNLNRFTVAIKAMNTCAFTLSRIHPN